MILLWQGNLDLSNFSAEIKQIMNNLYIPSNLTARYLSTTNNSMDYIMVK